MAVKLRSYVLVALVAGLSLAGITSAPQATIGIPGPAYIDPSLLSAASRAVSVIVTATDSRAAAHAVTRAGGQITSDLWLIDGVAAQVSIDQLPALAHSAEVQSITPNRGVRVAGVTCSGPIPCVGRPGWVTDTREKKHEYDLTGPLRSAAVTLRDGGLIAVSDNEVLLVNSDGTERARVPTATLVGNAYERFESPPVVGADGTIYLAGYIPVNVTVKKGWHPWPPQPANCSGNTRSWV